MNFLFFLGGIAAIPVALFMIRWGIDEDASDWGKTIRGGLDAYGWMMQGITVIICGLILIAVSFAL